MDVRVGEMNSTVHVTDSQALLNPALLEQITMAVLSRVRAEHDKQRRIELESKLQPALSSVRDLPWEAQ
jgi:hypothetical protein